MGVGETGQTPGPQKRFEHMREGLRMWSKIMAHRCSDGDCAHFTVRDSVRGAAAFGFLKGYVQGLRVTQVAMDHKQIFFPLTELSAFRKATPPRCGNAILRRLIERWTDQMRASILRAVKGSEIDQALPKRYFGMADATVRREDRVDLLVFSDDHVATSADIARALKRLGPGAERPIAVFMQDATAEALALLANARARLFTLHAFGWTDATYASIRQPTSRERDRRKGGWPQ